MTDPDDMGEHDLTADALGYEADHGRVRRVQRATYTLTDAEHAPTSALPDL
jgi:hypothetical protein